MGRSFNILLHISPFRTDGDPYIPGEVNPDGTGVNWWTNQNVHIAGLL